MRLKVAARRLRPERYDPDARDADGDGIVQEGTAWERPVGTFFRRPNGQPVRAGLEMDDRPKASKLVDADGNDVDYTPTYDRPGYKPGSIGDSMGTLAKPKIRERVGQKLNVRLPEKLKNVKQRLTRTKIGKNIDSREEGVSLSKSDYRRLVMEHGESKLPKDFWKVQLKVKDANGKLVVKEIDRNANSLKNAEDYEVDARNAKMMAAYLISRRMREDGFDLGDIFHPNTPLMISSTGKVFGAPPYNDPDVPAILELYKIDKSDPLYNELRNEAAASWLIEKWTISNSMISSADQRALQDAARDHFGLATEKYGDGEVTSRDPTQEKANQKIREAFMQAMHDETQEMFANAGITNVEVYRGVNVEFGEVTREEVMNPTNLESTLLRSWIAKDGGSNAEGEITGVPVKLRSMSAFSSDKNIAKEFSDSSNSAFISTTVPVERILATAGTGLGCLGESEFVLLGAGPDDTDRFDVKWRAEIYRGSLNFGVDKITVDDLNPEQEFDPDAFFASLDPELRQRLVQEFGVSDRDEILYDLWYETQQG